MEHVSNHRERIAYFVRDAPGELPEHGQTFFTHEQFLGLLQLLGSLVDNALELFVLAPNAECTNLVNTEDQPDKKQKAKSAKSYGVPKRRCNVESERNTVLVPDTVIV